MSDNLTVAANRIVRAKDIGSGVERLAQYIAVFTALPTVVTGSQTISVTTGSSLTVPTGATHALMTVDAGGGDIRYWEDGTTPASGGVGLLIPAGGAAELTALSGVRLRASTGTVSVNVSYRRYDQ